MNVKKIAPIMVLTMFLISLAVPLVSAATTIQLSVSVGPVGTKTVVTGTVSTYNGKFEIWYDADGVGGVGTKLGDGTATGYSYTKEVMIPNSYAGGRIVEVWDIDSTGVPKASAIFTVQTKWYIEASTASNYEGGPIVVNTTVTGGASTWSGALDLRFRIKDPSGNVIAALTHEATDLVDGGVGPPLLIGRFEYIDTLGPFDANLVTHGTYTYLVDWDLAAAYPTAQQGVATTTFLIRMTDKAEYKRTLTAALQTWVPAGKTLSKYQLTDPSGTATEYALGAPVVGGAWYTNAALLVTTKDQALGTYTVKLYDSVAGAYYKTGTFTVVKAAFTITITSLTIAGAPVVVPQQEAQRTQKIAMKFIAKYPNGVNLQSADVSNQLILGAYYNTTLAGSVTLDPLVDYNVATDEWTATYKVPKDGVKGKNYALNVTVNSIKDSYGNEGPSKYVSSGEKVQFVKAVNAVLTVTDPSLTYPGAGANLPRTMTAKASFQIKYPDGSLVTAAEYGQINATVSNPSAVLKTLNLVAADYNSAVGLWIISYKVPYNADLGTPYNLWVLANQVKDAYGNKGPAVNSAASAAFAVTTATISITELSTDMTSYESDDAITVTFKATYPSGDAVTKPATGFPVVSFYDAGGALINTKLAAYDSASGKYIAKWIIPSGIAGGKWNATVLVDALRDDAAVFNKGPSSKKVVNFEVNRVSLTDILESLKSVEETAKKANTAATNAQTAADAAKTAAGSAKSAADAAKSAADAAKSAADTATSTANAAKSSADSAKSAADAAKAAADTAGSKADAAKSAADAAKTAAESASSEAKNLATLVYVAIGASVIAALAAIVAVMQITRKVTG